MVKRRISGLETEGIVKACRDNDNSINNYNKGNNSNNNNNNYNNNDAHKTEQHVLAP